jgi:hypothetical protein
MHAHGLRTLSPTSGDIHVLPYIDRYASISSLRASASVIQTIIKGWGDISMSGIGAMTGAYST